MVQLEVLWFPQPLEYHGAKDCITHLLMLVLLLILSLLQMVDFKL